jgi:hypothetical protein
VEEADWGLLIYIHGYTTRSLVLSVCHRSGNRTYCHWPTAKTAFRLVCQFSSHWGPSGTDQPNQRVRIKDLLLHQPFYPGWESAIDPPYCSHLALSTQRMRSQQRWLRCLCTRNPYCVAVHANAGHGESERIYPSAACRKLLLPEDSTLLRSELCGEGANDTMKICV